MNHIQKSTPKAELSQFVNLYQLKVAKTLSEAMADNQALELLANDILYKVGNLALTQSGILKNTPEAKEYTDYILKAFTYYATEKMKWGGFMMDYFIAFMIIVVAIFIWDWFEKPKPEDKKTL